MPTLKTASQRAEVMRNYLFPVRTPIDPESVKLTAATLALMKESGSKLSFGEALREARHRRNAEFADVPGDIQRSPGPWPNARSQSQGTEPSWQSPIDPESLLLHNLTMKLMSLDSRLDYGQALREARRQRALEIAQGE